MADEAARKTPQAMAVSTAPDVCNTPAGPAMVPVPYPIVGMFALSTGTKPKVLLTGQEAFTTGSKIAKVTGDEAGIGGGLKSGVNISTCEFITYSTTVFAQGENIVRHNDQMWMNNRNTVGKVVFPIGLSANVSPGGNIPDNTDPVTKPETPQEQLAAREKKGFWESALEGAETNLTDKWEGIKQAASDPGKALGEFAGGVKQAVMHPIETAQKIGGAIEDTAQQAYDAYQSGDMEKLGQMAGSGVVELGIGVAGTKGLDKLGKVFTAGRTAQRMPGGRGPDIELPETPGKDLELPKQQTPDVDSPPNRTDSPDAETNSTTSQANDKSATEEPAPVDTAPAKGSGRDGTIVTLSPVQKALKELGPFSGKTRKEIRKRLEEQGYTKQKNGIYTKDLGDGNSIGVRMDAGTNRPGYALDKGGYASQRGTSGSLYADSVPHVHKEIVPTADIANGNYLSPRYGGATSLNDAGFPSSIPAETHIPTQR